MRFVLALLAFVVAAGMILTGIAQKTVLRPADHVTASVSVPDDVRYLVVPGTALKAHAGTQRLHIEGGETVFAAYGRSADVTAWLAGERYAEVAVDPETGRFAAPRLRTAPAVAGLAAEGADPSGADLWLDQQRAEDVLDWSVNLPATMSLLVAADGRAAAPSALSVTWPVRVSTPFATPLIIGGSVLLLAGLLCYMWALVHFRKRRGPRRKPPARLPKAPVRTGAPEVTAGARDRRAILRRVAAATGGATAGVLLLAGCGAPSSASTAVAPQPVVASADPAAVTKEQAQRIVRDAAEVAAEADEELSAKVLKRRFAGPAYQLRKAAYALHKADEDNPLPQAIPVASAEVRLTLPQQTDAWPRALFAVVTDRDEAKTPPLALTLLQATPRSDFKVHFEMALEPGRTLPELPSATTGGHRLAADAPLLRLAPGELAATYGLLLRKADQPEAELFDLENDHLLAAAGPTAKKKLAKATGSTAKYSFKTVAPEADSVVAFATADSGALVSVGLTENWTVKPVKEEVKVKPTGQTRDLSDVTSTEEGIASSYGYQLLFSVPKAGSDEPITLLGYAQGLISAKEL